MEESTNSEAPGTPASQSDIYYFIISELTTLRAENNVILGNQARIMAHLQNKTKEEIWEEFNVRLEKNEKIYLDRMKAVLFNVDPEGEE